MRWRLATVVMVELACRPTTAPTLSAEPMNPVQVTCTTSAVPQRLRRLTRLEWQQSVKQVLNVDATLEIPDDEGLGFSTVADAQAASVSLAEKLLEAAERATASMNVADLSPCPLSDSCSPRFIEKLATALFRRPVRDDELTRLGETWRRLRASEPEEASARLITQVLLQSPAFLFRVESSDAGIVDDDAFATRLAFALTGEGPDEQLRALAGSGALSSRETVRAEAQRLLSTVAARRTVGRFHVEWLGVSSLSRISRGAPDGGFEALKPSMEREISELGAFVVLDDHHLSTLLSGKTTFVDPPLGALYGLSGLEGDGVRRVQLDGLQRNGVLTAPGVLAVWAKSTGTSPTLRGRFVRERLLCEKLPTPPPNVSMTLPPLSAGTTRARFQQHVVDPACSGCHQLMDPIGFGLERYDEAGAFRLLENGRPIDAHGEVTQVDGGFRFEGAEPLAQWLAQSPDVRRCVATQWFRFVMGRAEHAGDRCTLDAMTRALESTDGDVREALLTLVTSDTFRLAGAP
ncbi:MAG: DUF1588 domain-containing protein [Myxococcaceae bacterium]